MIVSDDKTRRQAIDALFGLDLSKPWAVTIEPYKERRSLSQNSLYWKWVGIMAQDTGNDPDTVHEALKQRFLVPVEVAFLGEKVQYRTTASLDIKAMGNYMDRVQALAVEMGIRLPAPETA